MRRLEAFLCLSFFIVRHHCVFLYSFVPAVGFSPVNRPFVKRQTKIPGVFSKNSHVNVNDDNGESTKLSARDAYTEEIAYDPQRRLPRTVPDITTSNELLYRIQQAASVFTFCLGVQVSFATLLLMLPSITISKITTPTAATSLVASGGGGSRTAILALYARSQMNMQCSGGPDYLAPRLIERMSLFGSGVLGGREVTAICATLSRINFSLTRGVFEDQAAYIATLFNTGLITPMHVRTCWFDDCIETFVRKLDRDNDRDAASSSSPLPRGNVVILGSGFDTRCYRLGLHERNILTFEVDAQGTQDVKKRVLTEAQIDTANTVYCTCDFETQSWLDCLMEAGMDISLPTMLVWEGVTMYIHKSVIAQTLETVSAQARHCKGQWYIGFDYINSDWASSKVWHSVMSRVGEPLKFSTKGEIGRAHV